MANYKGTVHTDKAYALIAKMLSGSITELEFTKIKVSDKDYSSVSDEDLKKLITLEQIKQETLISEKTPVDDNAINIHGIIYNTDLESSYYLRTIGVYANDPDDGEILYSITATEVGDYILTPNGNNITTVIIDILTEIGEAKVNMQGNPSALVDVSMLNKKLDKGEGLEEEFNTAVKIVTELKKKQNETDNRLLTKAKKMWEAVNELFNSKLEKGGYTGTAKNLLDEISKKASKSVLGRIIIGKGLSVDSTGRTSIVSKNDGITVNENDIQLNTVDNLTTDSGTKGLSARQGKKLNENKQDKNDNTLKTTAKNIIGAINELFTELWKTASTTAFGRIKVGKNLSIDSNGFLNGAAPYTHPSGNGNTHLPAGGANGNFLKWLSAGVGQWVNIAWGDITGKPSTFTPETHKHKKSDITDFPTSMKNPNALTISLNGTSQGAYDGSVAKSINITASNVGASPSNHNHDSTYSKTSHTHTAGQVGAYTKSEIDEKLKNFCPYKVGDIYITANSENPASVYLNTTWQKIEGRFLLGTSGSGASKQTGGSNTKTIVQANLPNVKLSVDSFSVTIKDTFIESVRSVLNAPWSGRGPYSIPKIGENTTKLRTGASEGGDEGIFIKQNQGGETSSFITPKTSALGSGNALDVTPAYYTCHMWLRIS